MIMQFIKVLVPLHGVTERVVDLDYRLNGYFAANARDDYLEFKGENVFLLKGTNSVMTLSARNECK